MEHSHAVNAIKRPRQEGKGEYIGLETHEIAISQVLRRDLDRRAQIDSDYVGAPTGGHLGETAHAATHVENQFALKVLRPDVNLSDEILLGKTSARTVQLSALKPPPLITKAIRIVALIHKANDAAHLRKAAPAGWTQVGIAPPRQRNMAVRTVQQGFS